MSSTVASRRENWRRWEKSDYDVTNERQTKEADYEDGLIDEEGNGNGSHKWQQSHNSQQRSSSRKRPCEFVRDISERRVSGGPKSEPCPSPSKTGDILSRNLSTPSHKDRYPPAASKTQVKAVCSAHHNTEDHKMCNNRVSTMLPQKGGFSSFRETTTMDGGAIPGNRHATRDRGRAFSPRRGAEGGFFASQGDGSFDRSWDTDRYDRRSPSESKSSISPGLPTSRFQPASSVKTVANQLADNRGDNTRDDKSNNSYGGRQLQHRAGSWRDREQSSLRQPQREDHHSRRQPQQQHRGSFLSNQVKKQRLPQQESGNCEYPRHKLERGDDVTRRNEGYSRRPQQYHQHSSCLDSPSSRNEGNLPRQPQPYQHRGTAETAGARGQRPYQQQRRLGEDSSRSSRGGSRSRPGFHQPPSKNAHRQAENYFHCGTKEEGPPQNHQLTNHQDSKSPPQNHQLTNHQDSKSPLDVDSRGQRPQPNRRRSFDSSGTSLRGTESSQNGYSARPHRQHRSSMDDSCSSSYNGQGQSSQQHHPDRHQGSFRTSSFPKRHSTYTHHSELSNNHRPEEDDFRRSRLSFDDSRFRQEQQQRRAPHGQNINNSTEQPPASHSQDHQYSILDEQEQQYSQKKRKVSEEMQERNHTPLGKRWCNEERGADVSMQTAQLAGSPTKSLGKRWCPPQVSKHDATAETPNVPSTHDLGRTHQNTEIETSAVSSKSIEDSKKNDKRSNGIPLRWVKPSANPKKKLKGTSPKKQDEIAPPTVKGNEGKEKKFVSSSSQKGGVVYSKNSNKVCGKELEREKMSCGNAAKTGKTQDTNRPMRPPSPLVDRMVTDSEGGSTVSNNRDLLVMLSTERAQEQCIPSAIELPKPQKNAEEEKPGEISNPNESAKKADSDSFKFPVDNELDSNRSSSSSNDHTSDSEDSDTDEEEVMQWASKMFGVPLPSPIARRKSSPEGGREEEGPNETASKENSKLLIRLSPTKTTNPGVVGAQSRTLKPEVHKKKKRKKKHCQSLVSEKLDKKVVIKALESSKTKKGRKKKKHSILPPPQEPEEEIDEEKERIEREEEKRKKEAAKPLTAAQIRAILGEDDFPVGAHDNWVRRSVRQPSRALLNSKPVKSLVEKLKSNDKDMVVLKMKKFINDQNAPQAVLDVALDALEENSNCEALYIQNFNEGMRDRQVLHLLKILQQTSCKIWCLNIGENYNVDDETWGKFTKGLRKTKVTHMYASEHTITTEMKDEIRATIRDNRQKHDMHVNPNNLDVIVQCTHCWWNPINAKALRPYLKKKGYELILNDKEVQGTRGSTSDVPTV